MRGEGHGFALETDDTKAGIVSPELAGDRSRLLVTNSESDVGAEQLCDAGKLVGRRCCAASDCRGSRVGHNLCCHGDE